MAIFRSITPLVEPLSLDEAFLDVTAQVNAYRGSRDLAQYLKSEVKKTTGLTLSIGVGSNKTVAKIASDMGKPDGLVVVPAGGEAAFLAPLPVRALWGVGPKADAMLKAAGLRTVGNIAQAESARMLEAVATEGDRFRLLGIHSTNLVEEEANQLGLWQESGDS